MPSMPSEGHLDALLSRMHSASTSISPRLSPMRGISHQLTPPPSAVAAGDLGRVMHWAATELSLRDQKVCLPCFESSPSGFTHIMFSHQEGIGRRERGGPRGRGGGQATNPFLPQYAHERDLLRAGRRERDYLQTFTI